MVVPQIDLYKIHHFDNPAKATSLKILEFNMRSNTIENLPFDPYIELTKEQCDIVVHYNGHDVDETFKFYNHTLDMIRFREHLSEKYEKNFLNYNDTKIGKEYLIMELEKAGVYCYTYVDGIRKPIQTKRPIIDIGRIILPYIEFKRPEFQAIHEWMKRQH